MTSRKNQFFAPFILTLSIHKSNTSPLSLTTPAGFAHAVLVCAQKRLVERRVLRKSNWGDGGHGGLKEGVAPTSSLNEGIVLADARKLWTHKPALARVQDKQWDVLSRQQKCKGAGRTTSPSY